MNLAIDLGTNFTALDWIVGLTGLFVVPLRRMGVRMGVMTIPQFYEQRFSRGVRIFGGLVLALTGILNMGMFLRAGALFPTSLTGLADPITVKVVMTILLLLVMIYTVLGGFDPVQGFGWGEIAQNVLIVGLVSTAVWPTAVEVQGGRATMTLGDRRLDVRILSPEGIRFEVDDVKVEPPQRPIEGVRRLTAVLPKQLNRLRLIILLEGEPTHEENLPPIHALSEWPMEKP